MPAQSDVRTEWVNLSIHGLRWTPDGLDRARELVWKRLAALAAEGWVALYPPETEGVLQQGRGLSGPVVVGARLDLRRTRA
ncbi:MAG: hypothetical protein HY690_07205 [Chloroflexi bacterium]|nr:hypothetical protein [Chloroflexota bacterium]